jgi:putative transcriptional regulator
VACAPPPLPIGPRLGGFCGVVVNAAQVRAVRAATGLSQAQFARLIEVNVGTLRNWEQGLRTPTGPARALLKALKNRPAAVVKALQAA